MDEITPFELKVRLESGEPMSIVDIREADEFVGWHIHGSRNIPAYEALRANRADALTERVGRLPKDRPVVTVCRAGIVSLKAAELLRSMGFEASSLSGGMRGWGVVWSEAPVTRLAGADRFFCQVRRNGKGCLSYLFGSQGQAAVVDPSVDVEAYCQIAEREGLRITHVLETHVHADHLSRARDLCERVGAQLVMPPNERVNYAYTALRDGDQLRVGELVVESVATPGHTGESTCYLVDGKLLLTGDTLFLDSVGRPDLEKGDAGAEAGARMLHASLHRKLVERFDDVWIYPAHHGGMIGFDRAPIEASFATLKNRVELLDAAKDEFVAAILDRLQAKPPNYESIIAVNEGRVDRHSIDPLQLEAGPNRCAAG